MKIIFLLSVFIFISCSSVHQEQRTPASSQNSILSSGPAPIILESLKGKYRITLIDRENTSNTVFMIKNCTLKINSNIKLTTDGWDLTVSELSENSINKIRETCTAHLGEFKKIDSALNDIISFENKDTLSLLEYDKSNLTIQVLEDKNIKMVHMVSYRYLLPFPDRGNYQTTVKLIPLD